MAEDLTTIITSLGITNESFLAIVVIVLLVIGAVVVVIVSRPVLDIYPYLLPNAKIRARKGRLFDEKQFADFIEADSGKEIIHYLRGFPDYSFHVDTHFEKDLIATAVNHQIEKVLDIQLGETYNLISRIVPDNIKKVFKVLAKKSDIENIKTLLVSKEANLTNEKTEELLIPVGSLYHTFEQLIDSRTVEDVVAGLDGTEYGSVLENALNNYKETKTVLHLESALDKYYLESLLSAANVPAEDNTRILYSYIGSQVDIANLKIILRSKVDGLNYETIAPHIIEDGYQIKEWKLKDLIESENVTGIINGLENTDYFPVLNETVDIYNESGSVSIFEKALDSYLSNYANSLALKNPLGVGPIIGYTNKKEKEIKNLKIIVRAKREAGLSQSALEEMLL
ncbi:MAG: ATP synthase A1 subunit C [Methanobrevibacter sp.]|jgi:V/A-type H+-transporting ATPase subunit C|nr:ATP synthase A1 subunit C [Methanobrevibacter sp.]